MGATSSFGLVLMAILSTIAWIDWHRLVIPNALNLALAASGCLFQMWIFPSGIWIHAGISAGVFAAFWLVRHAHETATGRVGLGLGDVKMAGAAAIWIDPWNLPLFVFAASSIALAAVLTRELALGGGAMRQRQAFGPFLAAALAMIWTGEQWMNIREGW